LIFVKVKAYNDNNHNATIFLATLYNGLLNTRYIGFECLSYERRHLCAYNEFVCLDDTVLLLENTFPVLNVAVEFCKSIWLLILIFKTMVTLRCT